MIERPILFSAPMVLAILEGRKTMTRRAVKWPGARHLTAPLFVNCGGGQAGQEGHWTGCPYGTIGDRLWVRESNLFVSECGGYLCRKNLSTKETHWFLKNYEVWTRDRKTHWVGDNRIHHEEDWHIGLKALPFTVTSWSCQRTGKKKGSFTLGLTQYDPETKLVIGATPEIESREVVFRKRIPSIHMPRWASRITLEVSGVKVERVQDISEEDAIAEGVEIDCSVTNRNDGSNQYRDYSRPHGCTVQSAVQSFQTLWDSINAKRGYGWNANPWVWCVSFRRVS